MGRSATVAATWAFRLPIARDVLFTMSVGHQRKLEFREKKEIFQTKPNRAVSRSETRIARVRMGSFDPENGSKWLRSARLGGVVYPMFMRWARRHGDRDQLSWAGGSPAFARNGSPAAGRLPVLPDSFVLPPRSASPSWRWRRTP